MATALVALAGSWLVLAASPVDVDRSRNQVRGAPPPVSAAGQALHKRIELADLHCDALLWGRDLIAHNDHGHVDVPRLRQGRVTLQVFAVPTVVPRSDGTDLIDQLASIQRWPDRARRSPLQRALLQARRLEDAIRRSRGDLVLVRNRADLPPRPHAPGNAAPIAALLALEGAHALEGALENLAVVHAAGFRMITLAHFSDNAFAGSAHGARAHGLTALGRRLLRDMEARGIVVDISHASPRTVADVLAVARRPVVASHSGVQGTCRNKRNLTDDQLRGIARNGGVVGIGFWHTAVCGHDAASIARAVRHAVTVAGIDHVGLGSDFDGGVTTPFDAAHLSVLTDALVNAGFSEAEIRKLMGDNVRRVLAQALAAP